MFFALKVAGVFLAVVIAGALLGWVLLGAADNARRRSDKKKMNW